MAEKFGFKYDGEKIQREQDEAKKKEYQDEIDERSKDRTFVAKEMFRKVMTVKYTNGKTDKVVAVEKFVILDENESAASNQENLMAYIGKDEKEALEAKSKGPYSGQGHHHISYKNGELTIYVDDPSSYDPSIASKAINAIKKRLGTE